LTDVSLMTARLTGTMAPERFRALLTGTISLLSLLLAVVGLYGVVAYGVARRTREIGLRMALGARTTTVLWRILAETARTVSFGLLPGVLGAFALARWLATQHVVQASIAGVIAVALLAFSSAALLAAAVPAIRASRVNPIEALRED
jgi:ABC-type antimicrobial peptide transport system permease subunit